MVNKNQKDYSIKIQNSIKIQTTAFDSEFYKKALALRDRVLRRPLGLQLSSQDTFGEENDIHIVVTVQKNNVIDQENNTFIDNIDISVLNSMDLVVVGCLSLTKNIYNQIETCRMKQVAIDPNFQGHGIGKKMVLFAENLAKQRSINKITLKARMTAFNFYKNLGYQPEGELYESVGLPHQNMYKIL